MSAPMQSEFLDVASVAKRLGVSASFLNKSRLDGSGPPYVKIGRRTVRYDWERVLSWAAQQSRRSTSDRGAA
jgi:predicted DNA-binding transcriptional regulator AlpA